MMEVQIKLPPHYVGEFVKKTQKCDFHIDVVYNRLEIDGKSLLGMLSLDLNKILNVKLGGHDQELEEFLSGLAV
ncbi:MAG: HPr family phosphocarrier protein [Clostridiales bacterium]|nr:HPr family phosphocarrier protein [Clostridiales bacterium]